MLDTQQWSHTPWSLDPVSFRPAILAACDISTMCVEHPAMRHKCTHRNPGSETGIHAGTHSTTHLLHTTWQWDTSTDTREESEGLYLVRIRGTYAHMHPTTYAQVCIACSDDPQTRKNKADPHAVDSVPH